MMNKTVVHKAHEFDDRVSSHVKLVLNRACHHQYTLMDHLKASLHRRRRVHRIDVKDTMTCPGCKVSFTDHSRILRTKSKVSWRIVSR